MTHTGPFVLHVVQSGDGGGVQRHIRDLACGLPQMTAAVAVGTGGWLVRQLESGGIHAILIPHLTRSLNPIRSSLASRELASHIRQTGANVVHAHGVIALMAALTAVGDRPLLYTPHGFQWRDPSHSRLVREISHLVHRAALPRLTALIAVSDRDAADAAACGTLPQRILQIPNGVALPAQVEGAREANLVGTAARLVPGKGIGTLLQLVQAIPEMRLAVAGSGPSETALRQEATRLGVDARVEWMGWQDNLDAFYRRIAVYVSLSAKEGLPYGVLDAMAAGLPVLASDIPGHRDLLQRTTPDLLVRLGDPDRLGITIRGLISDARYAARCGDRNRDSVAARFSLSAMLEAHATLYARSIDLSVAGDAPLA